MDAIETEDPATAPNTLTAEPTTGQNQTGQNQIGRSPSGADPVAKVALTPSRQFPNWLAEQRCSLSFTTYQAGKLFLIGLQPDGRLSIFERSFNRCMGLCSDENGLWMSTLYQLWRFQNVTEPGQSAQGYDRLYLPQVAYTTGDLDIHDVAVDGNGRVIFVNTLFGCLATVSPERSFIPLWQPPFLSKLAAEDRCHLNGLAMEDGRPRFVTAVSQSDVADGWRDKRADGGCVIDVPSGEVVTTGLSMPHSPRLHNRRLWLLDSGTGYFGFVDPQDGRFERVAFCPGYLRGLTFSGDFAVVGLSRPRGNQTFGGLALDENLSKAGSDARCGLMVIDLKSGDIVHWLRIEGVVEELYDVVTLPGATRPMALGFRTDEIRRVISVGEPGAL
ncbi:TIGR03032 family protein [Denitrobaculum tricleocarpae]|uniref:TIGR03032 family protein n=1 Tax=Denitrobaculum tricleocarpae TaxID=2591009 RepID=A0A545TR00_9PROT|nr:TIGR03032 family protein [Denitrobaculum tricleocarpae]TQV79646.1 TIGR03032 family protein [Denitrobaculum tricleocarpae]